MSTLFSLAAHITGAWATATELAPLLIVPALIWGLRTAIELLDHLARVAQLVYRAGRAAGAVWFRYGLPLLLVAADGISWINSQIDWLEVRDTVIAGARVLLAMTIAAGIHSHQLLIKVSAALGRSYSTAVVRKPVITTVAPLAQPAAAPAVHPLLIVSDGLEQLTASQLRSLLGTRKRCSKTQLIGMALAC